LHGIRSVANPRLSASREKGAEKLRGGNAQDPAWEHQKTNRSPSLGNQSGQLVWEGKDNGSQKRGVVEGKERSLGGEVTARLPVGFARRVADRKEICRGVKGKGINSGGNSKERQSSDPTELYLRA